MTIIFGTGELGKNIYLKFYSGQDVLFYDNDRRLWGKCVLDVRVIDFAELTEVLKNKNISIINGVRHKTGLFFLKDLWSEYGVNVLQLDENGELIPVDFTTIEDWNIDVDAIQENKVRGYEQTKELYIQQGKEKAYQHAADYIKFKKQNMLIPEITGIELTNHCNLSCVNCPTPTCKREKGFMSDEVFEQSLKYIPPVINEYFSMHGLGEPLLHPKFLAYLAKLVEIGIGLMVSTNGLLLNEELMQEMFYILKDCSNAMVFVSLHTKKSVDAWLRCADYIQKNQLQIGLSGRLLEHNREYAENWLLDVGIDKPHAHKYITYITSHSFAGNVEYRRKKYNNIEVANRFRNCYFINSNTTAVAWDGRLKSCCLDSELQGGVGNIFEYESAGLNKNGYELCKYCDPDWTSNFQ